MDIKEYASYDGLGLAQLIKEKQVTYEEVIATALQAIEQKNPAIQAVAQTVHTYCKPENENAPFYGVPILFKEYPAQMKDIKVRLGSRLTAEGIASPEDSALISRFKKAGFIPIGTTTTPEFAVDGSAESLLYGPTKNPWDISKSTGGSSGGAAAAVAAGIVPLAHANDSGGSIRMPAAYCHLIGLKPTRGRMPSGPFAGDPLFGLATEFAITKSVRDTAALLDALSGPDVGAYSYAERPRSPFYTLYAKAPRPLKIAYSKTASNGASVHPDISRVFDETIGLLQELGHDLIEDAPVVDEESHFTMKIRFWTAAMYKEVNELAEKMNKKIDENTLEPVVYSAYEYGKTVTAQKLLEAIDIQNTISRKVGQFFSDYDVFVTPTTAQPPFPLGTLNTAGPYTDVVEWFLRSNDITAFEGLYNTTGQPAISLPLGFTANRLPVGIQFAGRFSDEKTLLQLAYQLEKARPWVYDHLPL